ncbi:MAG: ferrous iron transport protein A [Oscillospiraceae bacterium]|nr:ferrous iron transport protein A [Oscillospiraceae bacterium]
MPLTLANPGVEQLIKKVGGKAEIRQFLENLGIVQGGTITMISQLNGNVIVKVKESRIAISREMASKILV